MRVDITAWIAELDAAVAELVKPPFYIWEPFDVVKSIGKVIKEALPLATEEEYKAALMGCWLYEDGKHKIVEKVDNAIAAGILEPFDGYIFRKSIETVAIPQLAGVLARQVG